MNPLQHPPPQNLKRYDKNKGKWIVATQFAEYTGKSKELELGNLGSHFSVSVT